MKCLTLLFASLAFVACTRSGQSPEVQRLSTELTQLEHENAGFDAKLRDSRNDPGLHEHLQADRELLKSRIERLREQLKQLQPSLPAKAEESK